MWVSRIPGLVLSTTTAKLFGVYHKLCRKGVSVFL